MKRVWLLAAITLLAVGVVPANQAAASPATDRIYERDLTIAVGPGRTVHVKQKFTLKGLLTRRAVLMLPGPIVTAGFYDLRTEGYGFQSELARAGFQTFAVDYEGRGESSQPADGNSVTHEFLVAESRRVLETVRRISGVRRIDVLGESTGGAVASELCADASRTRSCVMSTMIYRTGTPFFTATYLDPNLIGFLRSQPNGYLDLTAPYFGNVIARSPKAVADETLATQPGRYAVGPLLAPARQLPWFDPSGAKVPGLLLHGTEDNVAEQSDGDDLRTAYGNRGGGAAELVRIPGGGHIPRVESAPVSRAWTSAVLRFLIRN